MEEIKQFLVDIRLSNINIQDDSVAKQLHNTITNLIWTKHDLVSSNEFFEDIKLSGSDIQDDKIAKQLYDAMTNLIWTKYDLVSGDKILECSWTFREAAGAIAEFRGKSETYLDFYYSGKEGSVSELMGNKMIKLGWKWSNYQ
jgi:hypothetical protein